MSKAILFLNGEPPTVFPILSSETIIYCTDGAYTYLIQNHIQPHYIVGDFDSANSIEFESNVNIVHRPDQNYTDFDKTLELIASHGYQDVHIYGSTGQEHDHFLGNLSTAMGFKDRLNLTFHDDYATFYFTPKAFELNHVKGKTISLVPFPTSTQVNSTGLKYPLKKLDLALGKQIGTRNYAIEDKVKISYASGELLIFISNNAD